MILIIFIVLVLAVGSWLVLYEHYLDEKQNRQSCYDIRYIKGAVRGIEGMLVSESMLQYKRNKVSKKYSRF